MIDQADDLRKLLSSSSKAANAPQGKGKSAGCEVNKESAGCEVRGKESAGCEVRGAEKDAQRAKHDAQSLRTTHYAQSFSKARVLSITSGKGGVGKTNIAVNLAYALKQINKRAAEPYSRALQPREPDAIATSPADKIPLQPSLTARRNRCHDNRALQQGEPDAFATSQPAAPLRVLIIDADLGLANVNILLGISSQWTLQHVIRQEKSIAEVIVTCPDGLQILPASSGIEEMTHLTATQKLYLKSQFDQLDQEFDFVLIDTAAGIGSNVMSFNQMAQEVIVILSPDPTSLADAYATIKVLATKYGVTEFQIIVNNTQNASHGRSIFQKLEKICQRFLKIPIQHLGTLSADPHLVQASRNQQVVVKHYPKAKISQEIQNIAESVSGIPYDPWSNKSINFLLNNVLNPGQE